MTDPRTSPNLPPADRALAWSGARSRVSWGAVFAGFIVATALQILLTVLGAAIGFTALGGPNNAEAFGIGAAIWALIIALVALFVGGLTAGRVAAINTSSGSLIHGSLVWALSLLLAVWLVGSGTSRILGSTLSLAGNVTGGVVTAAGEVASRSDVGPSDVQRAAAQHGVNQQNVSNAASQVEQKAGQVANKAQGIAAGAMWAVFVILLLSLGAAIWGTNRGLASHGPATA